MKKIRLSAFTVIFVSALLALPSRARAQEKTPDPANPGTAASAQPPDPLKPMGLRFYGDLRFRFTYVVQGQDYSPTRDSSTPLFIDHELNYRLRARLGVEKSFGGGASAGIGIITSGDGDPADPYWTLGGGGTFKPVGLDRAYFAWMPGFLDGRLSLWAGKFENPLDYSPITWSEDVSPEGAALALKPAEGTRFTVLYFRLQDNGPSSIEGAGADPFLADFQLRQEFQVAGADLSLTAGYQYVSNTSAFETGDAGVTTYLADPSNPPGAPLSITSKGMVGDSSRGGMIPEMHVVEALLSVSHELAGIPVRWLLHGAYNLSSFNLTPVTNANVAAADPGSSASNALALYAGLDVGKADGPGLWAGGLEWGYIEPDAVFSAFNSTEPGLGHNNNTWVMGKVEAGLEDGLVLSVEQYLDWRVNYDVFGPAPTNVIGATSRDPILRTVIDVTARL